MLPRVTKARHGQQTTSSQERHGADSHSLSSGGTNLPNTLILDLQPSDQQDNQLLLCKPSYL